MKDSTVIFQDVWNKFVLPLPTFFKSDHKLDLNALRAYASLLNLTPVETVLVCGSTGEGMCLSHSERLEVCKVLNQELRRDISAIICPSTFVLHEVQDFQQFEFCSGLLILPTSYFEPEDPRLVRLLSEIHRSTSLPLYLYHFPRNTLFPFSPEDIKMYLRAEIKLGGIKLSHEPLESIPTYRKENTQIPLFYGSDRNIKEAFSLGADKIVSQSLAFHFPGLPESPSLEVIQKQCDEVRKEVSVVEAPRKLALLKSKLNNYGGYTFPLICRPPLFSSLRG